MSIDYKNSSGHPDKFRGKRGLDKSARHQACEVAGMSRHQMYKSIKIANIPEAEFEAQIESKHPRCITKLARIGLGQSPSKKDRTKSISWDRLVKAWNDTNEVDRQCLLKAAS